MSSPTENRLATTPEPRDLVVGAGAGGLTMALLLGMAGRRVTLVDAAPQVGGLLRRFSRRGVRLDTGFHFTGGMGDTMSQLLELLGFDDMVEAEPCGASLILKSSRRRIDLPNGDRNALIEKMVAEFPEQAAAVREYFKVESEAARRTPLLDLRNANTSFIDAINEYDAVTLEELFARIGASGDLCTALAMFASCHGSLPRDCSVNHHCRVSWGMNNRLSAIKGGGDTLIAGFEREMQKYDIEVVTNTCVAECTRFDRRFCRQVKLSNGRELACNEAFFAVHPQAIRKLLPPELRVGSLAREFAEADNSCGFFTLWGVVEDPPPEVTTQLVSVVEGASMTESLLGLHGSSTGVVVGRCRLPDGREAATVNAFTTELPEAVAKWKSLTPAERRRDAAYLEYKERRTAETMAAIHLAFPELEGKITLLESATSLTYRDYDPPFGCAYGVRQKVGVRRLFGRLPVRNFYAIGQSALMPGVLGTMLTSLVMFRQLVGGEAFSELVKSGVKTLI